MHATISKTNITKALTALESKVNCKTYGKQQVFVIKQPDVEYVPEEIDEMDNEITTLKEKQMLLKEEFQSVQAINQDLCSTMSIADLNEKVALLEKENSDIDSRLEKLRSGKLIDPQEKKDLDLKFDLYNSEWKKRKRQCLDVVNVITENMDKKPKDFMEEIGIELDAK